MPHRSSFSGDLQFLSNMYPIPCPINGQLFPCSETAYMAFKTTDRNIVNTMLAEQWSGYKSKRFFRINPTYVRSDWSSMQLDAMWTALQAKFCHHGNSIVLDRLMRVPDSMLVERNTWGDRYWGVDYYTGKGENKLGRMLKAIQQQHSGQRLTDDTEFVLYLKKLEF